MHTTSNNQTRVISLCLKIVENKYSWHTKFWVRVFNTYFIEFFILIFFKIKSIATDNVSDIS